MSKTKYMKKWILFVHEPSGDHYFWNGNEAVCVQNGSLDFSESLELSDGNRQTILDAANAFRQKLILLDKVRYIIVARGTLKEY